MTAGTTRELPTPPLERPAVIDWVTAHLGHLSADRPAPSPAFVGGQTAADRAFDELDITGYARTRSLVDPPERRGASKLSPYVRHGLLQLRPVWERADGASGRDRFRYQGELLWQEHARHWYAIHGSRTAAPISHEPVRAEKPWDHPAWWREMTCLDRVLEELHTDGWAVNQARMWLASHFCFRAGGELAAGEDAMFRHLLDGSRAANRLGWQWCAGTSRAMAHGFARQQVAKRAPRYCESCNLSDACPIAAYAKAVPRSTMPRPDITEPAGRFGPSTHRGPCRAARGGLVDRRVAR